MTDDIGGQFLSHPVQRGFNGRIRLILKTVPFDRNRAGQV